MENKRRATSEPDCTDEELQVFGDFSDAERDGKKPDIEEYLRRVPESADKLRPILETAVKLCAEVKKLRAEHPDVNLARLLDPDWHPKGG